jgi:NAD(P)-dependent dehydrogenase (short-subunit alcohol dehydrogenase family)
MKGVFLVTKHAAKAMQTSQIGGVIINTASVAGITGSSGPTAYSAAKAGVISFTKNAAIELSSFSIRVNAICPGLIYTPLIAKDDDAKKSVAKIQPLQKKGGADDIANTALFLASDDSAFITGDRLS